MRLPRFRDREGIREVRSNLFVNIFEGRRRRHGVLDRKGQSMGLAYKGPRFERESENGMTRC